MTDTSVYSEKNDTMSRKTMNEITSLQEKLSGLIEHYTESQKRLTSSLKDYVPNGDGTDINVTVLKDIYPSTKYVRCAKLTSDLFYNNTIGSNSFESCKQIAIDKGSDYFGYQGSGNCVYNINPDSLESDTYFEPIELWSMDSGQSLPCTMTLIDGNIVLQDLNGNIYKQTQHSVEGCSSGSAGITDIRATWGASCPNVKLGNATTALNRSSAIGKSEFLYTIGSDMDDPSPTCKKPFDIVYKCGQKPKFKHVAGESTGQNVLLTCDEYASQCACFLILADDGTMAIYKGTNMNNKQSLVYTSGTGGKQLSENSEWISAKGKGGINWISNNSGLMAGEWIGNSTGSLKLIMQTNGKLQLLTSQMRDGCDNEHDPIQGYASSIAVYKLSESDAVANRQKVGYIDNNSVLYEYPESLLKRGNTFTKFENYTTSGGGSRLKVLPDISESQCQEECVNENQCVGLTYDLKQNMCTMMKDTMFPRQIQAGYNMYVRNPELSNEFCPNEIGKVITGNEWNSYVKSDIPMTADKVCGVYKSVSQETENNDALKRELDETAQLLQERLDEIKSQNMNINSEIGINSQAINNSLQSYRQLSLSSTGPDANPNKVLAQYEDSIKNLTKNNIAYMTWGIIILIICIILYFMF
jgi:hypothetical protein